MCGGFREGVGVGWEGVGLKGFREPCEWEGVHGRNGGGGHVLRRGYRIV